MSELPKIQELHDEIRAMKKERKEINQILKDELSHVERYGALIEEMQTLKEEKKSIENEIRERTPNDALRLDELKIDIKSSEELMSDLAFNLLMKDETVEISDEYDNRYEPQFLVKFKKAGYTEEEKK